MKILILILALSLQANASVRGDVLKGIESDRVSKFFNSIWSDAEIVSKETGLPQSLLMAMAALESGYGSSNICISKNNYLGIKSTKKVNGKRPYRTFKNRLECFRCWGKILQRKCYQELPMTSLNICLYLLESCHYHQSKNYSNKIRWIYYKFGLDKLEDFKK